jgi:hypothetical protein
VQLRDRTGYRIDEPVATTIARVAEGREGLERLAIKVVSGERRPDRWAAFRHAMFKAAGALAARCERVAAGDVQPHALSHLAIWRTVEPDGGLTLVVEDAARFEADALGQLAEVLGDVAARDAEVDLVLLGWSARASEAPRPQPLHLEAMDWTASSGGLLGYLISPRGARTLIDAAGRDGMDGEIGAFLKRQSRRLTVLQAVPSLVTGS